jgi:nicotinate-nucleotide adenylyltransferase
MTQTKPHSQRIGIYAGAFDPVHAGHVAFALQALEAAQLDKVYFLPERRPRHKQGVEHFAHRVAMLKRASAPHRKFGVLEYVDISFSVARTLPRLRHQFAGDQLVFLFGSDAVTYLPAWPNAKQLLRSSELIVGVRATEEAAVVRQQIMTWDTQPKALTIFDSYAPNVSSGAVREALRRRRPVRGLLHSVAYYSNRHWLYVAFAKR